MQTFSGFDWDNGNREKCQRHGVSITDIEALLRGNPGIAPDLKHSDEEDRYIAVGRNPAGRSMFVAFMYRMEGAARLVRPISARYMHKKEAEQYEKKNS